MSATEDFKILEGIATGDTRIIKDFYRKNFVYIKSYILKNSGNDADAEDVFQDGLIVIYQKLTSDTLEIKVSLKTYFYAICKNIWRNRLRKKTREKIDTDLVTSSNKLMSVVIEDIENDEQDAVYRRCFFALSNTCREVLNLFFEGNSMRQIGAVIGSSEGYARKKKFECKKTLLEMIEKDPIYQELNDTTEK